MQSLDQAVKKRRGSIANLTQQGEEIIQQSINAGQATSTLQSTIVTFNEKWERLVLTLQGIESFNNFVTCELVSRVVLLVSLNVSLF